MYSNLPNSQISPSVSIGIITLAERTKGLYKLLQHLTPVVQRYSGEIEVVIANNSGESARTRIAQSISNSSIENTCPVNLVDSPQNNIATGRNILLEHSQFNLLAFLDDDEYPCEQWLEHLIHIKHSCHATVVAGPVRAVFHESAPRWVHTVDLHNTQGRVNAQPIDITGTGNVLIDKSAIGSLRFDESFGKTGGSDTDFFMRVRENNGVIYWASNAIAYEDIPPARSTSSYLIHRFIKQGENYRRISLERNVVNSTLMFSFKSLLVVLVSFPVAGLLVIIWHPSAGHWMKRAFSNYGKLHSPNKNLYDS